MNPETWLVRQQRVRHPITAVKILCPRLGHLVASVHPVPGHGPAAELAVWLRPARYRASLVGYLTAAPSDEGSGGWQTVEHRALLHDFEEFDRGDWVQSATWACRCGLGTLAANDVISAAYGWSADRALAGGNPPQPRVVMLS